jgi:hypothetical protein
VPDHHGHGRYATQGVECGDPFGTELLQQINIPSGLALRAATSLPERRKETTAGLMFGQLQTPQAGKGRPRGEGSSGLVSGSLEAAGSWQMPRGCRGGSEILRQMRRGTRAGETAVVGRSFTIIRANF